MAKYIVYRQTIVQPKDHLWTFIGAFFGIGIIGFIQDTYTGLTVSDKLFMIGSFGASSVLIYGATNSPLAQPRNLVLGHIISALIGVSVFKLLHGMDVLWLNAALAVSLSIVAMQLTKTMHPPGGATALIANMGTEKVTDLGYSFALFPVSSGVFVLLFVALITNNIPRNRSYPNKPFFNLGGNNKNPIRRRIEQRGVERFIERNRKRV